jgi:hypothetical protein
VPEIAGTESRPALSGTDAMSYPSVLDEDLTPRFRWRWGEHGIYLGVSSAIGLLVLALHLVPMPAKRRFDPTLVELIQVRYVALADEMPEPDAPLHDPRLVRRPPEPRPGLGGRIR